ncbi:MAG: thioesterase domain-containing protein [Cytophagales bacterium]|nr:thioesterase domain-containing protein [Cytophagales bacterium]
MPGTFVDTEKKIKLFALPYAGGSAAAFYKWKAHMNSHIDFIPVELAGRGKRISEKHYGNLENAVDDLYNIISKQVSDSAFALFGHSMGCLLIHELIKRMKEMNHRMPQHLFFSGKGAIQIKREDEKIYHKMPDDEFRKEIVNLGGTPPEFFDHPELMELFLPLMKSDFAIAEAPIDFEKFEPIDLDITVFNGKEDDLDSEQHEGWKFYTTGGCHLYMYEGDHFFLNHKLGDMAKIINSRLSNLLTVP